MTLEEVARLRLEILGDESAETIDGLQKGLKDINSELRLMELNGEKGSEAWKELKRVQKDVNEEITEMTRNIDLNDASMNELTARSRQLNRELGQLKVGSQEWIDKLKEISQVDEKISSTREEMRRLKGEGEDQEGFWVRFKAGFAAAFTVEAVMAAIGTVVEFGKEIFETAGKFERYEAVLKNALGTQEAATKAMDDIKALAAATPFTVDELTESYVKYVNRGLQPTMAEMTKLGDIAASQGKSFDQLTEAILDATTGEFERLKEFGIQASKAGDEVSFSFKGVNQTVANTPEAIKGALLAFGDLEGVAGGMAAIAGTLEGRFSNLQDNFDSLKIVLGDVLKPVFEAVMDVMNAGIDTIKSVVENSEPIVTVFDSIAEIGKSVWESIKQLIGQFVDLSTTSITVRDVMGAIGLAFNLATVPIRALLAVVGMVVDGYNILINKGKEVANFFGADFKVNPQATFDNMLANADKNFKAIGDSWKKNVSDVQVGRIKDAQDKAIASENAKYKAEVDRINKTHKEATTKAAALAKAEQQHTTAITKAKADALRAEAVQRDALIKSTIKNEGDRDKQLKASKAQLNKDIEALSKKSDDAVTKHKTDNHKKTSDSAKKAAETDANERKKADEAANKAIEDARISLIKNDLDRAIATENAKYQREIKRINDSKAAKTLQLQQLEVLEQQHTAKIEQIKEAAAKKEEAAAKKKEADEKAARDRKLKEEGSLLDATFRAEIEKAKLSLSLTTNNAQAQYDAKVKVLEAESRYRAQKLQQEAAAEKARTLDSIQDTEKRAATVKSIEERLAAQLKQNEQKLQADKVKLQEEATAKRKKDNDEFLSWLKKAEDGDFKGFQAYLGNKIKEEKAANADRKQDNVKFFDALKNMMKGDFSTFTQFLAQKTKNDTAFNSKRFQEFSDKTQQIGQIAQAGVQALQRLNQAYLQRQEANIKKERDSQLKAWQEKYKKGLISKDEYEKGVDRINKNSDAKLKDQQKKAFERDKKLQIAMALISGGMAFIKALASGFFPLNLVFAAATAVATGIQIAQIRRQQFQGGSGGTYVRNAGVLKGGYHGSNYGEGGIAMIDRATQQEVGEVEGDEPIMVLSRNTYRNNRPVIDRLLHSSLHKNGAPITLRDGGVVSVAETPYWSNEMFKKGGRKARKEAERRQQAEAEAAQNEVSYDSGGGDYDSGGDFGGGGGGGGETEGVPDQSETKSMIAENTKLQKAMYDEQKKTNDKLTMLLMSMGNGVSELRTHTGLLNDIKNKPTGPSLHEIQGAFSAASAASAKSDL